MAEATKPRQKLTGTQIGTLVGALAVYACAPTTNIPNVITTELQAVYSSVDPGTLSYFLTITNLLAMAGAFLFGVLAGKYVKFKTITLIAIVLFVVGGAAPLVLPDGTPFIVLVLTRAVLGLALGCFTPMAQSVVVQTFAEPGTRSYWLGIAGICFNLSLAFGSTIAGMLALINWRMAFAFYLIGFIPMILMGIFFKGDPNAASQEKEDKSEKKGRFSEITPRSWILMFTFFAVMLTLGWFTSFGRLALTDIGVDSALFGTIMSVRTVGSILVAAVFGLIYKFAKKFCLGVGAALVALAFALFFWLASSGVLNVPVAYIAAFSMGFGMNMLTCGMAQILSVLNKPAIITFLLGINTLAMNFGSFASSPTSQVFFGIAPDAPQYMIFMVAVVICVALTVVNVIAVMGAKDVAVADEEVGADA